MNASRNQIRAALAACLAVAMVVGCTMVERPAWFGESAQTTARKKAGLDGPMATDRVKELRGLAAQAGQQSDAEKSQKAGELATQLGQESNPVLRAELCRTLAALRTHTSLETLVAGLKDPEPMVRLACVQGLAEGGGERGKQALADVLRDDAAVDVRIEAARALANYQGKDVEMSLAVALEDSDPALQRRAIQSLATVSGQSFGNDVAAWRTYVQGGSPERRNANVAEQVKGWLYSF